LVLPKYTPYLNGQGGVRIGLKPIEENSWLEIDDNFKNEIEIKKNLLLSNRNKVLQFSESSVPAQKELLELVINHLKKYYPDKYDFDEKFIHVKALNETFDLTKEDSTPIKIASMLVQEDLVLMMPKEDEFYLEAASLVAPSHWSLIEKFSKSLMNVHEGVPGYKEKIGSRVNQIFNKLPTDRILERLNWSIYDSPELFQPEDHKKHVKFKKKSIKDFYLRVERQTIRKLKQNGSIVFTIRVHVDPLVSISKNQNLLSSLEMAINKLPKDTKEYKALDQIEEEVLNWIGGLKN
jgi:hypothetical protein|tara:strand:+ start:469 stop:1347 length:879 start_codon:yes stop_codon:yes gene_type:complete